MQAEELKIEIEWGHIAGKWWGPHGTRPILLLHGEQDNAGSFDRLVRHLPSIHSYLAIDWPGYGHSSHLPNNLTYSVDTFVSILEKIRVKFEWTHFSLVGHLMGATVGFVYAGTFPEHVDLLISLSILPPCSMAHQHGIERVTMESVHFNGEPPLYTVRELVNRTVSGSKGSVRPERTIYLIRRTIKQSNVQPDKYYYLNDIRTQQLGKMIFSEKFCLELVNKMKNIPHLFLKTNYYRFEGQASSSKFIECLKRKNKHFVWHNVRGTHHVHLNQPERVSILISKFLQEFKNKPKSNL